MDWTRAVYSVKWLRSNWSQIFPRNQLVKMVLMSNLPFQHFSTELALQFHMVKGPPRPIEYCLLECWNRQIYHEFHGQKLVSRENLALELFITGQRFYSRVWVVQKIILTSDNWTQNSLFFSNVLQFYAVIKPTVMNEWNRKGWKILLLPILD